MCPLIFTGCLMRLLVSVISLVFLSACATSPTPKSLATPVPPDRLYSKQAKTSIDVATLVVTRDQGVLGSACYFGLWIDTALAGRFDVSETATFYVPAGEHLLKVGRDPMGEGLCHPDTGSWVQRETMLKAGETKNFRISLDPSGTSDIHRAD